MTALPRSLYWQRTDLAGAEQAVLDDRRGLHARGTALAPPYSCRYELITDESWATTRFEVTTEGPGWTRGVKLRRDNRTGWRVTATEEGTLRAAGLPGIDDADRLADALDIDLYASPLTNTLPLRRLRLETGVPVTVLAAWVLLPSLTVMPNEQTYTLLSSGRVRYSSGTFTADLDVDEDGYVTHYPGLASLVTD